MKVVLFCGGLGTRLREHSEIIPKPLVNIGPRPILWHIMRYYAYHGHKDFIICLGYKGDAIREYFLNFNPYLHGNVTLNGAHGIEIDPDEGISDWRITFVDTGLHSNIGERLMRVRHYLEEEEMFLANYSDQVSDLPLNSYISEFKASHASVGFISVKPSWQSYHTVQMNGDGIVKSLTPVFEADQWVNGGYFVMRPEIFDYMQAGEEMVEEPFARLAKERKLWSKNYLGFWKAMDTFKDKIVFDRMWGAENMPWCLWRNQEDV
ncbi:MAG: sugar phosphate nucleotidyltransferase [Thiotrichales bacterium]